MLRSAVAAGESPPLAMAHLAAAVIGYPTLDIAMGLLAWVLASQWAPGMRFFSGLGVVGGISYSLSAPIVVVARVAEADFLFALGAGPIAIWLTALGLAGLRSITSRPSIATAPSG